MGWGWRKRKRKQEVKGGREGNGRENTATLQSSWPDGKVIFELAFVGLALHLGNQVMVAVGGEACFLQIWGYAVNFHHRAEHEEKGTLTRGLIPSGTWV